MGNRRTPPQAVVWLGLLLTLVIPGPPVGRDATVTVEPSVLRAGFGPLGQHS